MCWTICEKMFVSAPDMAGPATTARAGLRGARIAVGVCGGIAAYKAADIVSTLAQGGAVVDVMLSRGATQFIQPLTFQALSHRSVYTDVFEGWNAGDSGHVTIAREADVVLIAPATANAIAHLASGMVEDMIGAVALATEAPVVIAPAMEHHMWHHPATHRNLETLRGDGATVIDPESGYLASGARGDGRLASRASILHGLRKALGRSGRLAGRHVVVSAGGTREALDPVRYIGNRSSGAMGVALALAALDAGADVMLVATPTVSRDAWGGPVVEVESAEAMHRAITEAVHGADVLIMAAAVSDFRPKAPSTGKIKKQAGDETLTLDLVKNPDIIKAIEEPGLVKVGFAAETDDLVANAESKLVSKGLSMIVANDAVRTIGSARSEATLLFRDRPKLVLPELDKDLLAARIISEIIRILNGRQPDA